MRTWAGEGGSPPRSCPTPAGCAHTTVPARVPSPRRPCARNHQPAFLQKATPTHSPSSPSSSPWRHEHPRKEHADSQVSQQTNHHGRESRCPPLPGTSEASGITASEGGGCWELGTGKPTHLPPWGRALARAPPRFASCGGARLVGTYRIFHTCLRE